ENLGRAVEAAQRAGAVQSRAGDLKRRTWQASPAGRARRTRRHMDIGESISRRAHRGAFAALLALGAASAHAATWVFVANADSQEISVLSLDRQQGKLEPVQTLAVGGTVMPMVVSADRKMLHAALRSQPYRVVSMAIDPASGKLEKKGEASLAESMANID